MLSIDWRYVGSLRCRSVVTGEGNEADICKF